MRKFGVISGFLGAGKTTLMLALTKYYTEHCGGAAMISNDLGTGVTLADHRLAKLSGARCEEITGACICDCHDALAARLDALYAEGNELVLSDIPGFGVGALEHVYHGLNRKWPGRWTLAPFTAVTEPDRVGLLRGGDAGDAGEILTAQLREAELIVLNKCDLRPADEIAALRDFLAGRFPDARVLCVSAAAGDGLDDLARALRDGTAALRHPAIDYRSRALRAAMGRVSEYYLQYRAVVCCDDFDGTAYLADIARRAREGVAAAGAEIPHLKLLGWGPEGDFGKLDLLGVERPTEVARPFAARCRDVAVLLNASALCPAKVLDAVLTAAAEEASAAFRLEMTVFRKDCFGMR